MGLPAQPSYDKNPQKNERFWDFFRIPSESRIFLYADDLQVL